MVQLQGLVDSGNTVVVVEHDMGLVARSDWVVDVGPGAGSNGGRIVAAGTPREMATEGSTPTATHPAGHYLSLGGDVSRDQEEKR